MQPPGTPNPSGGPFRCARRRCARGSMPAPHVESRTCVPQASVTRTARLAAPWRQALRERPSLEAALWTEPELCDAARPCRPAPLAHGRHGRSTLRTLALDDGHEAAIVPGSSLFSSLSRRPPHPSRGERPKAPEGCAFVHEGGDTPGIYLPRNDGRERPHTQRGFGWGAGTMESATVPGSEPIGRVLRTTKPSLSRKDDRMVARASLVIGPPATQPCRGHLVFDCHVAILAGRKGFEQSILLDYQTLYSVLAETCTGRSPRCWRASGMQTSTP